MVKLKRMLGDIDDPTVVVLMALIESQSAETLANWSLNYVEQNLLSIYQKVLKSLQLIAIDNENNPVKVNWYC